MSITQLQAGEKRLGEYLVQIARPTASGWVASIPPITATLTNRRLILVPQTRKPYPPASIPGMYILKAASTLLGQRRAVQIRLTIGYNLNLFVGWGQGEEFANQIKKMLLPSLRQHYTPALPQQDLIRLIEQISKL
ncbi:MAG TPA: hypothetical protein VKY59_18900 [Spirillospora sp.]|nr:hypothetical protein [Spirillospora sp.]